MPGGHPSLTARTCGRRAAALPCAPTSARRPGPGSKTVQSRTRVPGGQTAYLVRARTAGRARPGTSVGAREWNQSDFSPLSARILLRALARAPAMAPAGLPKVEAENRAGPVLAVKECA